MKIEKVLTCAGLIGLAASLTFIAMAGASRNRELSEMASASILFPILCFAFIIIGRLVRAFVRVLHKAREEVRVRHEAAYKGYADAKIDVPDVD